MKIRAPIPKYESIMASIIQLTIDAAMAAARDGIALSRLCRVIERPIGNHSALKLERVFGSPDLVHCGWRAMQDMADQILFIRLEESAKIYTREDVHAVAVFRPRLGVNRTPLAFVRPAGSFK
jgi:hypothetical protein